MQEQSLSLMKILIVEDEPALRAGLIDLLKGAGHSVDAVGDGATAVERGTASAYDLVLLDLMLPRLDGIEVCRRLRRARPAQPGLMLTARGAEDDKVDGLKSGADDYMTKPFGARELLARVEAIGRRAADREAEPDVIEIAGCTLDLGRCEVKRGETVTSLTLREVGILRCLHRNHTRAVSRADLLAKVWGAKEGLETRTVDMAIANLRQKIEADPAHPQIVVSVKGAGYIWAGAATK